MQTSSRIDRIVQIAAEVPVPQGASPASITTVTKNLFVDWIGKSIPDVKGTDILDQDHYLLIHNQNRIETLRIGDDDGQPYYAAEFTHPCKVMPGRSWQTEFGLTSTNNSVHFGMRLTAHAPRDAKPSTYSTPNFVKILADSLGLQTTYGVPLLPEPRLLVDSVTLEHKMSAFMNLLQNPQRNLPIIVVTSPNRSNKEDHAAVNIDQLARNTMGIAHIYYMDNAATYALAEMIGREMSVYNGGVRFYNPGFKLRHSPLGDHPLVLSETIEHRLGGKRNALTYFIRRAYEASTSDQSRSQETLPDFSKVRSHYFKTQRQEQGQKQEALMPIPAAGNVDAPTLQEEIESSLGKERDHFRARFEELASAYEIAQKLHAQEISAMEREIDESIGLAVAEEEKRRDAERQNISLLSHVEELEKIISLQSPPAVLTKGLFPPLNLIDQWADACLGETVVLTNRAVKAAKSSDYRFPDIVYRGLLLLKDGHPSMGPYGDGQNRMTKFNQMAARMGLENRFSIHPSSASQFGDTYYTTHNGQRFFLSHHLTKGDARDPKNCLRIYYTLDGTMDNRIIVGHLPSHLRNNLT